MILTLFRARLRPSAQDEHARFAADLGELARQSPGYLSHKTFVAEDGECLMVVEFQSERAQRIWSERGEYLEAERRARAQLYMQYRVQVCVVQRESSSPSSLPLAAL